MRIKDSNVQERFNSITTVIDFSGQYQDTIGHTLLEDRGKIGEWEGVNFAINYTSFNPDRKISCFTEDSKGITERVYLAGKCIKVF